MKILVIEPGQRPYEKEIDNSLSAMQAVVGGLIQALFPFEEPIALICNDEGKLQGLAPNRVLRDEHGVPYDIIVGTFFLCGAPADSEEFEGLTEAEVVIYLKRFLNPEIFV